MASYYNFQCQTTPIDHQIDDNIDGTCTDLWKFSMSFQPQHLSSLWIAKCFLFCFFQFCFPDVPDRRMAAAEVNGSSAPAKEEEEPMDVTATHTENYQTLLDAGLPQKVAESLDNIFQTGGQQSL